MEHKLLKKMIFISLLLSPIAFAQIAGDTGGATPDIGSNSGMTSDGRAEDWKKLTEQKEIDKTTARPSFYAMFKSAQSDVMAGKLPKAEKKITKLHEMQNKNTYEQARIYLLDYWYAGKLGDKQKETESMEALVPIGAGNIDSPAFIEAGMRLFKRQYNNKDYGGALDTLEYLRKDSNSITELNSVLIITNKLEELAAGNQNISHPIKTDETGSWTTKLLRSSFLLENISGEVRTVDFNCENKSSSLPYKPESAMSVPASWGKCKVKINSAPNTSYNFIQLFNKPA